MSPLFSQPDRYPALGDPPVSRSQAAKEAMADVDPLRRWPLFGRASFMEGLIESARRAVRDSAPTIVAVTAEAGYGKSHVFHELELELSRLLPGATVLAYRSREPVLGDADRTLVDLLRRALDSPAAADHESIDRDLPAVVALALDRGASHLPGSEAERKLRSLGTAPGALRSAMMVAAGEALRRIASDKPLLVLLDDAQFAGELALGALEVAALAEARAPVWICAFGRPSFAQEHPTWGERAGCCEARSLDPLDPESAEALCRMLLLPVESAPKEVMERIVERARAVPLMIVELVRSLSREGAVRHSPRGEYYLATDEVDRLPDLPLIEWFVQREIESLGPELRGHAYLLALLGDQVTAAEIGGVLRWMEQHGDCEELTLDGLVGVRRLMAAGVVVQQDGQFRYRHALVREAIARSAPEALRQRVHVAAADYYREADTTSHDHRLSQFARHASAAGLATEAAGAFFALAERSRVWHAYTEAERLYSCVLEQPGLAPGERAAAHRGRGLMRYRIGRHQDSLDDLAIARGRAEQDGDVLAVVEILLDEATAFDWTRDFASSKQRVREVEARMPPDAPPLLKARLLKARGRSAMRFNRNDEAEELLKKAADAAAKLGDEGYETFVIALLLLSFLLPALGRIDDARWAVDRIVGLCEAHGDHLHLSGALMTRGLMRSYEGDKDGMVEDLLRSLAIAREVGQPPLEMMAEFNSGEYLLLMDDAAAAAPHIARAMALDLRINGHPGRPIVTLLEARLRLYLDDVESAATLVAYVRERQSEAQARGEPDMLMVPSDEVLCEAIELWCTDAAAAQWDALEARSAEVSVGQERIEVIEARVAAARRAGRLDEARGHLERAMDLASRIPNAMSARLARRLAELRRR